MQPSYRTAPEAPRPAVVVYRPQPIGVSLLITFVMLGMVSVLVVFALGLARTVTLDISRPENTCVITRTYPFFGDVTETHPFSSIRGTQLVVSRGKHGSRSYGVNLTTAGDPIVISSLDEPLSERGAQKRQIDAFLVGTDPSLHMVYDLGAAGGLLLLLLTLLPLLVLRLMWMRARVVVDPVSRMLRIERPRWPLRAKTQSFDFGELRAVVVRSETGRKGGRMYRVVLVLGPGQTVQLLPVATSAYRQHTRAAEQIRTALQDTGVSVGNEG